MAVELMTVPVISTSHVTKAVQVVLEGKGDGNPWTPCAAYEHGWFLYMQEEPDTVVDTPPCLIALYRWAKEHGYRWVRLDSDADEVEGLKTYDW